jgi:uncharacterized membrane protein
MRTSRSRVVLRQNAALTHTLGFRSSDRMRTTAAPFRNHVGFWALAFLSIAGAAACGGDDHDDDHEGSASGATCPADNTLTYDNFGRDFMSKYCTKCHSSTATDRHGAPANHDFDTLAGILPMADHIDEHAAAGPNAVNTEMPPEGETAPSEDERRKLGQWLACETEEDDAGGGTADGGTDGAGSGNDGGRGDGRSDATQSDGRGGGG